ncbi:phosphatase PAP2 family protein [soil metagenome]
MPKKHTDKTPSKKPKFKTLLPPRVQLILAVLLFFGSATLVHDREMSVLEIGIFQALYLNPEFLTPFFLAVTQLGSIFFLAGLTLLLMVKKYYQIVLRLLFTGSLAYLLSGVAKDLVGRGRPHEFISDVVYKDFVVRGSGFPSGHTALATAIALSISVYLPSRYKWFPPAMIIGVGLSRMHLGPHGPMDMVGGFAVGWFCFALFHFVQIRLSSAGKMT